MRYNSQLNYKYEMPISATEFENLLNANENEPLWTQKVRSKWVFFHFFNALIVTGLFLYFLRGTLNTVISLALATPTIILIYHARTTKYSILANEILFEWGLGDRKKESVPFTDITAIKLVEYHNSKYSTIFFGTKGTYKIKKLNYDQNGTRHHITFENVVNGPKVVELLNLLWRRFKTN